MMMMMMMMKMKVMTMMMMPRVLVAEPRTDAVRIL